MLLKKFSINFANKIKKTFGGCPTKKTFRGSPKEKKFVHGNPHQKYLERGIMYDHRSTISLNRN